MKIAMNGALLIEIGCEELPPMALEPLAEEFARRITTHLADQGFDSSSTKVFASPRRIAAQVFGVREELEPSVSLRRGPSVEKSFENGKATKAALGFAKSCGTSVENLSRIKSDQGEWLAFEQTIPARKIDTVIDGILSKVLGDLPSPKRMRWSEEEFEFIRPIRWITSVYKNRPLACKAFGISGTPFTQGHRIHAPKKIEVKNADDYVPLLENQGYVMPSPSERRRKIAESIEHAVQHTALSPIVEDEILREVSGLVEWPSAIVGSFEKSYLELPEEVLIASMQNHQKYFPTRDENGRLSNHFIAITNLQSRDPKIVQDGNERVINPRLADAAFFFLNDRKLSLESRLPQLEGMLFERRLGSLKAKTERIQAIATTLATSFNAIPELVDRAATLSRCDLLTDMVGEFPKLQGLMGSYYARNDGEKLGVSQAIETFYHPRYSGDTIPRTAEGQCLSFSDRLDTLVGIFSVGSAPSGEKDPFALRRAALGALRILVESEVAVDLKETIATTIKSYPNHDIPKGTAEQVLTFLLERLRIYFNERSFSTDVCNAVFKIKPTIPAHVHKLLIAVETFCSQSSSKALLATNKRINNILRKSDQPASGGWKTELLVQDAEKSLAKILEKLTPEIELLLEKQQYSKSLDRLTALQNPVDLFFEDILVMTDDKKLKQNRLAILNHMQSLFFRIADFSELRVEQE